MEQLKTPDEIVQEMLGDKIERVDYNKLADEVIENVKRDFFPNYVRTINALVNAEKMDPENAIHYHRKGFEVSDMCIQEYGIDPKKVPEYYFELDEVIEQNQQVWDWLFQESSRNLRDHINLGRYKFPSLEEKKWLEEQGYTLMVFGDSYVGRGYFLRDLESAFQKEFGHKAFTAESYKHQLDQTDRAKIAKGSSLVFTKPVQEIGQDEEFAKTWGMGWKTFENFCDNLNNDNNKGAKIRGFDFEDYIYFQVDRYLENHDFADQLGYMSLPEEFKTTNSSLVIKATRKQFDVMNIVNTNQYTGMRLLYEVKQ